MNENPVTVGCPAPDAAARVVPSPVPPRSPLSPSSPGPVPPGSSIRPCHHRSTAGRAYSSTPVSNPCGSLSPSFASPRHAEWIVPVVLVTSPRTVPNQHGPGVTAHLPRRPPARRHPPSNTRSRGDSPRGLAVCGHHRTAPLPPWRQSYPPSRGPFRPCLPFPPTGSRGDHATLRNPPTNHLPRCHA